MSQEHLEQFTWKDIKIPQLYYFYPSAWFCSWKNFLPRKGSFGRKNISPSFESRHKIHIHEIVENRNLGKNTVNLLHPISGRFMDFHTYFFNAFSPFCLFHPHSISHPHAKKIYVRCFRFCFLWKFMSKLYFLCSTLSCLLLLTTIQITRDYHKHSLFSLLRAFEVLNKNVPNSSWGDDKLSNCDAPHRLIDFL